MNPGGALRVAILTHSTNPRGGVVHALELGDALVRLGNEAVVHAPDARGSGFFRPTLCGSTLVVASPLGPDVATMIETRVAEYLSHFDTTANRRFDVFHAQDGISSNALATLKQRRQIHGFARTVHHIDDFEDPRVAALQARSIIAADELFVVSRTWRDVLRRRFGRSATIVGNGVDSARFAPAIDGREEALRGRLGLGEGPVFLSIGGVEERKNTLRLLEAFDEVRRVEPAAQLILAGGASVLDHGAYQRRFATALARMALPPGAVAVTGTMPQDDMPALYRLASALVFPSVKEGFGLAVIEAMACGVPVVLSKMAPFTEHLGDDDVMWCDPFRAASIADAMLIASTEPMRARLARRGPVVAKRHDWGATARAHLPIYTKLSGAIHA
jgi:glycosyltransferase-like protein